MMRPRVTVAYAQTLDGCVAAADGTSRWISGPQSLVRTHQLRAAHHAILVGIGTVLADDPQLTVRLCVGQSPIRVVLDSHLRMPLTAQIVATASQTPTWALHASGVVPSTRAALMAAGVRCLQVPEQPGGGLDLGAALAVLVNAGVMSLMVEGGQRVLTAVMRERLVDRVALTIAPKWVGSGTPALLDIGVATMAQALTLRTSHFSQCGDDIWLEGECGDAQ
jgi:5-amino-6-(5-phosphoribosylamino)uracil reductase/diaminohydroxyphosphoribosylaminopyrimidine deaminase/5-amino-6-(5-phosphoribosylamino)uracil reductase